MNKTFSNLLNSWNQKGVTIVNDGWSDAQRRPFINVIAINESGPMFLESIDEFGEIKDTNFIVNNEVQIIINNEVVCFFYLHEVGCKGVNMPVEIKFSSILH